jgi:hypothetical protein
MLEHLPFGTAEVTGLKCKASKIKINYMTSLPHFIKIYYFVQKLLEEYIHRQTLVIS